MYANVKCEKNWPFSPRLVSSVGIELTFWATKTKDIKVWENRIPKIQSSNNFVSPSIDLKHVIAGVNLGHQGFNTNDSELSILMGGNK